MNEITETVKEELVVKTHDIIAVADSIVIKTEMENAKAASMMAEWKKERKRRVEIFAPAKKKTQEAYDEVRKVEAAAIDPIDEAISTVDGKVGAFVQAENERRAQLQAIEDAKVAEAQRKEDERIKKLMEKAEEKGKPAPVIVPKVIPARVIAAVAAPQDTTYREYWSAKVTDIKALCAAVAGGTVDVTYVQGNDVALNAWAKLKKVQGEIFPGVVGVKTTGTAQR